MELFYVITASQFPVTVGLQRKLEDGQEKLLTEHRTTRLRLFGEHLRGFFLHFF